MQFTNAMEAGKAEDIQGILRLNMQGFFCVARHESLHCFKDLMLTSMISGHFPLKVEESVCTRPTVWVLHHLNTSGASHESKIIGVYATRADGTEAVNKELGAKTVVSASTKGVSYWRVPEELIECWSLEECLMKGSLYHPVHKKYADLQGWLHIKQEYSTVF